MPISDPRRGRAAWAFRAAAGLLVLLAAGALIQTPPNHDVAWYVYMVDAWLHGGKPYVNLIDTNPPLILLITAIPVWMAALLGADPLTTTYVFAFGCALAACVAADHLLDTAFHEIGIDRRAALAVTLLFVLVAFPKAHFAQREHFAVMATMPYILLAAGRASCARVHPAWAVIAGVAGACGFALKPHFLLPALLVETAVALNRRTWRSIWEPAPAAAAVTLVAYALLVMVAFPEYFLVADRVRQVYGGMNSPAVRLLTLRELQLGAAMGALGVLIRLPRREAAPQLVVAAAAAGFTMASVLQLKGWSYHLLPAQSWLVIYGVVFLTGLLAAVPTLAAVIRGGRRGVTLAMSALMLLITLKYAYEGGHRVPLDLVTPLRRVVVERAPGGVVTALGMRTFIYPAFPLVNETGARWGMRHNGLWFLAGFYERELMGEIIPVPYRTPQAMSALERSFFEDVVSDLTRTPPGVLIVEIAANHAPAGRRALDLIGYYSQDPRFSALIADYELVAVAGQFEAYARRPPGPTGSGRHQ